MDDVEPVRSGHSHVDDLDLAETKVIRETLHDGAAEVDHEARRLAGPIPVREGRRIVAYRKTDDICLFHGVERSGADRSERQRRCQGDRDEAEKTDSG